MIDLTQERVIYLLIDLKVETVLKHCKLEFWRAIRVILGDFNPRLHLIGAFLSFNDYFIDLIRHFLEVLDDSLDRVR